MTIPQAADSTDRRSLVSQRQDAVTLVDDVAVVDHPTTQAPAPPPPVTKPVLTACLAEEQTHHNQQQQKQQQQEQQQRQQRAEEITTLSSSSSSSSSSSEKRLEANDSGTSIEEYTCVEASLVLVDIEQGENRKQSNTEEFDRVEDDVAKTLQDSECEQGVNTEHLENQYYALKIECVHFSLPESHENNGYERENNAIEKKCDVASCETVNNQTKGPNHDEEIVSALPLLKIPSHSSISTPSVSYDHRTRKSSINFPISNRGSSAAIAISTSSSSSASSSHSSSSYISNSRKTRRKSLPQRLSLRYQKIPQDDIISQLPSTGCDESNQVSNSTGILNPQYIPSPESAPFLSSPSRDNSTTHHQLSFHNAQVHATFHPSSSSSSPRTPNTVATTTIIPTLNQAEQQQFPSTSQNIDSTTSTLQAINQAPPSFSRDVTFVTTSKFITTTTTSKIGSIFNPNSSSSSSSYSATKADTTKNPLSAITTSSTSAPSSSKNRNKSGRGGNKSSSSNNKTTSSSLPLRQTLSLSLKSLNDLSVVHPAGRGRNSARKKYNKAHSRSVSTEDLANCRVHRTAGGRIAGDPHPSPGSPSHCCLVSVSRVPMAAATSHLTLDSEYQTVRLAVLGAPGVGKSSIVKQFVMQQFLEEYVPTEQRQVFCPAVIINDHLYEVRIIDCPYIPYFPVNSLYEWTDFRGYGLRNATAYVLVYDITSEESFEYIKSLRLQILESRNLHDVPIFVVGNKHDLAEERGVPRREVANLVKKQWKCGYIECSAKFNWHIMLLFKELMKTVDYIDYGHKPTSLRVQDALRRNRCLIL